MGDAVEVAMGKVIRHKEHLVIGGHMQDAGIDYEETFALVMKYVTLRQVLLSLSCIRCR